MRVGSTVAAVGNQEIDPCTDVALTAARQVVDSAYTPAAIAETVGQVAAKKAGDSRNKDLLRHRLPLGLRSSLSYGLPSAGGVGMPRADVRGLGNPVHQALTHCVVLLRLATVWPS